MKSISKKTLKKKQVRNSGIKGISARRRRAIEQAIKFWRSHALDIDQLKFDREEANAR